MTTEMGASRYNLPPSAHSGGVWCGLLQFSSSSALRGKPCVTRPVPGLLWWELQNQEGRHPPDARGGGRGSLPQGTVRGRWRRPWVLGEKSVQSLWHRFTRRNYDPLTVTASEPHHLDQWMIRLQRTDAHASQKSEKGAFKDMEELELELGWMWNRNSSRDDLLVGSLGSLTWHLCFLHCSGFFYGVGLSPVVTRGGWCHPWFTWPSCFHH